MKKPFEKDADPRHGKEKYQAVLNILLGIFQGSVTKEVGFLERFYGFLPARISEM